MSVENLREAPFNLSDEDILWVQETLASMTLDDKVSCGLDITRSKPDPEVFLVAAQKLEMNPALCLVVEDSAAGVVAAKAAGMKSLGVGPYHQTLGADYEATNLAAEIDWESILA